MTPTIQTRDGHYLNLLEPCGSAINIDGIAHALSNLCRFTGHVREFYSVAQHSLMVSLIVPENVAREGLLHDAQEAYIGDVSTPLKRLLPRYEEIEKNLEGVIAKKFGLDWSPATRSLVKRADTIMLATERRDLLGAMKDEGEWGFLRSIEPLFQVVRPMSPESARRAFLQRADELGLRG